MTVRLFVCFALALMVCVFGFGPAPAPAADTASIYDTLADSKDHTILFTAIKEAGEATTLKGDAMYTLFAPPDTAFKKLDDATVRKLATDKDTVKRMIRAHVVIGKFSTDELKKAAGKGIATLAGNKLAVEELKDGFKVGGAKLTESNIACSNGTIHVVDTVLPIPKE